MAASNNGAMLPGQVSEVIDELARQDPVQATEFLSEVGSNWNRNRFFARILGTLATDAERSSLLTSLLASDADGSEQAVKALFENWGRYDFDAPLAAATRIENPSVAHAAMLGILIWGLFNPAIHQGADPQRILAHADALSDPAAIGRALYSMSEYTRSVDLGQKTDELAAAIEALVV